VKRLIFAVLQRQVDVADGTLAWPVEVDQLSSLARRKHVANRPRSAGLTPACSKGLSQPPATRAFPLQWFWLHQDRGRNPPSCKRIRDRSASFLRANAQDQAPLDQPEAKARHRTAKKGATIALGLVHEVLAPAVGGPFVDRL
jgi:hypothetical protein